MSRGLGMPTCRDMDGFVFRRLEHVPDEASGRLKWNAGRPRRECTIVEQCPHFSRRFNSVAMSECPCLPMQTSDTTASPHRLGGGYGWRGVHKGGRDELG